jgi:hypothetical protein
VQAQARGCHTTRTGEVDIQMSFDLPDRSALAGYQGALSFHADLVRPTSWTTVASSPHLIDRPDNEIFHLVVPDGEPIPASLVLHVRAEATDLAEEVSAASVADLSGGEAPTPFGTASVGTVAEGTGSVTIDVTPASDGLGAGVTALGPGTAVLRAGGKSFPGTLTSGSGSARARFEVSAMPPGRATLSLGSWILDLQPDVTLEVPVGVCTAG